MWKKIKEILCKHTAHKDETSHPSAPGTITTSMINLKPLPSTPSRRTEALNHHRPYRKAASKSTLNKTDEHCRSLFNLLPTSFRPRHQHQTSHQKGVDASTTTTTQTSPTTDRYTTDYDSGYMSQSVLNRTSSYVSCYSAVANTMPIPSMIRHGSIESLLHGHSKSNPASVRVLVRRNFEPFAQAHIGVHKGMIVTALFSRGPWLYIRLESNGQTGYIPRIICSLYQSSHRNNEKPYYHPQHHLSVSSTDSSSNKDDELDLTILSTNIDEHFIRPYAKQKQQQQQPPPPINRYLSHSSAVINDQSKSKDILKKRPIQINHDERERRNTCTLPPPPPSLSSTITSSKDRRLTLSSINWPVSTKTSEPASIHQVTETSTSMNNEGLPPTRDTDSSSTQDSGYSESTPYYLVQQTTPDTEPTATVSTPSKKATASPHYATVRRSSLLKSIDSTTNTYHNSLRRHHPPSASSQTSTYNRISQHRHTLFNGLSMNDILSNSTSNKRHSFGAFYLNDQDQEDQTTSPPTLTTKQSVQTRPIEFALIRNVRRDKDEIYQRTKPTIYNLPKSHRQIPASICLHHHRQQQQQQQQQQRKQQFGSSHSAFRPVQPTVKSKRASSEGHSPSSDQQIQSPSISSTSSSMSSSNSSLNHTKKSHSLKQRRLSCDLPVPLVGHFNSGSLTRSVCEQISMKKLNPVARTMSEILCDQFSELNLDAIEKDSLAQQQQPLTNKKLEQSLQKVSSNQPGLFTITKDYRSSRASFSVKRGDCVYVLKQVGRACFLVRKQTNGQVGFLPKALMIPTRSTKIDTFLEMHGYRETVI